MDTGAAGHDGPGFIRSLMDAPCPHEVSSWGDYVENSFTPELTFRQEREQRQQIINQDSTDDDSWEKLCASKTSLYLLIPD